MKNILITGGSDGIGLAVARLLAAEGRTDAARVTLVARNEEKLKEAVASLPGSGHEYFVADLSLQRDVEAVASHLTSKHYDVLINNAGVGIYGRFAELPLEDQLRMMRLNVESVVVLSHHFLRQARKGDALVNTASFLGYSPMPGASVYSATKAFVAVLSETLWWEYKEKGVYVLGFSPGVITTSFHTSAGSSADIFPRPLLQSPEQAAGELVRMLRTRTSPRAISGRFTRLLVGMHRFVSRKAAINMMGARSPLAGT
jgi:short-subunit dehydrogenase